MTSGSPARIAVAGTRLAGVVLKPVYTPSNRIGVGPLLPLHIVLGKFTDDAPCVLEKRNKVSDVVGTGGGSTANWTVFDVRDSRWAPASHSTVAVLVIICGVVCADAGRLATGSISPVASTPAYSLMILVNGPIFIEKGDVDKVLRRPHFSFS